MPDIRVTSRDACAGRTESARSPPDCGVKTSWRAGPHPCAIWRPACNARCLWSNCPGKSKHWPTSEWFPEVRAMEASLEAHLDQLLRRHGELRDALAGTGMGGADFAKLSKEYSELTPIVDGIEKLRRARNELSSLAEIAGSSEDRDLRQLAEDELRVLRERLPGLEQLVKLALLPKDYD